MFFLSYFFSLTFSLRNVIATPSSNTPIEVDKNTILIPTNPKDVYGTIETADGTITVFGDTDYYILNFTVSSTVYVKARFNSCNFYYGLVTINDCTMSKIMINPPNGHITRISTNENSNITMESDQRLCYFYVWEQTETYKFELKASQIEQADTLQYSITLAPSYTKVTSTTTISPYQYMLGVVFDTDVALEYGYVQIKIVKGTIPAIQLNPTVDNMFCVNSADTGLRGEDCDWQIIPTRNWDTSSDPNDDGDDDDDDDGDTDTIVIFVIVFVIVFFIMVIVIILYRRKAFFKCCSNSPKVSTEGSNNSSNQQTNQTTNNNYNNYNQTGQATQPNYHQANPQAYPQNYPNQYPNQYGAYPNYQQNQMQGQVYNQQQMQSNYMQPPAQGQVYNQQQVYQNYPNAYGVQNQPGYSNPQQPVADAKPQQYQTNYSTSGIDNTNPYANLPPN